ncbi:MAG: XrtN system VIT domain protein [Glaciecola sp.]|jgi:XrtN system VIT domain protein
MEEKEQLKSDFRIYLGGVFTAIAMAIFYLLVKYAGKDDFNNDDGALFLNMIVAAIYFGIITVKASVNNKWRVWRMEKSHYAVSVVMICISAFTVNLAFSMFHTFTVWTEVSLFLILTPLLLHGVKDKLPHFAKVILAGISGFGIILSLYFTLYLAPATPIGIIGILFLGLGIHVFAPLLLLLKFISDFRHRIKSRTERIAMLVGILLPLCVVAGYLVSWKSVRNELHNTHATVITNADNELPNWILLSQNLEDDFFTTALIKGGIYYDIPKQHFNNWFDIPSSNGIKIMHDPLIFTAFAIFGDVPISRNDRMAILNAQHAARHSTESKLWSDENLRTVEIVNNIRINPSFRYAYTEKTISIMNDNARGWPRQEEALYSFHVPEGAVVTSLSLWVEGVERKSRLSTKKKATAAYTNIVGVQRRDPALAHWQEGNRITVRVFPCTKDENRMFKIGITTPLTVANNKLIYENFYFEGPQLKNAMETTLVHIESSQNLNVDFPSGYHQDKPGHYQYTGSYNPELLISMDLATIDTTPFCFNGNCYQMNEQSKSSVPISVENVYLDINSTLSKNEFDAVLELCVGKNTYVYWDKMIKLDTENKELAYEQLSKKQFSLFPLHHIKTKNNLLVTKSNNLGPNLSDLNKTKFKIGLKEYLNNSTSPIKVLSLNKLSDYWSSLNQFQLIDVHYDDVNGIKSIFKNGFPSKSNNDSIVYVDNARVQIVKFKGNQSTDAPDHLLRIFAFNQLMKRIGPKFYNMEQHEDELFSIANEAFILSPISSMIVLETDKDYDDNGIDKNENSLKNASMNSSGSVPEPHEWALIIMAVLIMFGLYYNKYKVSAR